MISNRACIELTRHYEERWHNQARICFWNKGPVHQLPEDFCILEFAPTARRAMWTYATCCMSQPCDVSRIEVHMFCRDQTDELVELLTAVAHYHRTGARLGLGHTVNFGRGWRSRATCEHGLVSLPYLDGPDLENAQVCGEAVRCLWLVPVTSAEIKFMLANGRDKLENLFEVRGLDYLNARRASIV